MGCKDNFDPSSSFRCLTFSNRFRWVFCQLEVLRHCFPTNLRRVLDELPKSLDETYKRILNEINNANRKHAYRLLQCLAVASRPLRVEELAQVLAFDLSTGGIPKLIPDWRWEDQEAAVLSACSSLISIISKEGSRVVQFSHFSVKEFLTSDRLASCMEDVSRFYIPIERSHVILARACLGVLLRLDDHTDHDSLENIPLLRYAAGHWDLHARVGNMEFHTMDAMDCFFDMDKPHFLAWFRIQRPYTLLRFALSEQQIDVLPSVPPLHYAARIGFRRLVERLIYKHPDQVTHLSQYGTPLHASVFGGHIEVAQLLITHGAEINSLSDDNWTPLHIASREGHVQVVKWLLRRGAHANPQKKGGWTPLHLATAISHLDVVRILLEHDAEVNARSDDGYTPLLVASMRGHLDVVRLLLDHNADANVPDIYRSTPLHLAACRGFLEVSQLLLEHNAEVDAWNDNGSTPLHRATKRGHPDVVQLLLDHNAHAHVHDNSGNTPLHFAAENGHLTVTQILLKHGAEANSRNDRGLTSLHVASGCPGKDNLGLDVVRSLLHHEANVHACDNNENTPLHSAARHGQLEVAQILLEHNAEVHARNDNGSTPLLLAFFRGNYDMARKLLEFNADVNSQNRHGSTPLLLASKYGSSNIVQLLLDHNAHVNVCDGNGDTPLHCAAGGGQLQVACILFELNLEAKYRNCKGPTPLHFASDGGPEGVPEVVRLLLDHGADTQARNLSRKTASEVACGSKQLEIVQLLSQQAAERTNGTV